MAIKNAINRIKSKAYGYSSDKTSASERIKARATGIGEHSYYTIDKWQKDHQSSLDAINKYSQVMNSGGWMSADDLSKYKSAIDTYTSTGNSLRGLGKYTADEDKSWLDSINSLNSGYNDASSFYNQFADENEYGTWWNYNTQKNDYTSVTGAEDYKQNSQYVKDIQDNRYNFINKSKGNSFALPGINYGNAKDWTLLPDAFKSWNEGELELTDEEIGVYNYYYATQGKEKAEEYLDFISEEIKQRKAGIDYKNFKTLDKAFDTLLNVDTGNLGEYAYGFGAGVESGVAGIANIGALIAGTEGYTPSSQYTSAMIRNDLGGDNGELTLQQVFYDLANTTGNMAPSLLAGGAGGAGVGALTMGLSSAGNNYTALLKEGYGENAARAFGIMTGVAEAGMSYAFSGISKLGGKLTQNAVGKMVSGVNNALARTAIQVGGSLAGEAIEEVTQTALEPVFKWAATLGEAEFEAASWEDIAYSALLGAMSAGLLEGAPTVAGTAIQSHQAFTGAGGATLGGTINAAVDPDVDFAGYVTNGAENVTNKAVEYANELENIDPGNKAAQYVRKRAEAGKNVSGYQINRLADEINSKNRDTVKGAIKARLDELGEKGNTEKLADVLTKVRLGEALSASEEIALNTSKNAYLVLTESDTSNVRGGGVANKWANSIVDRIDGTKSNTVKNATAGKQDEKEIKQVAKGLTDTKGFTEEATNAMVKGYDGNMPADDYSALYQAAYDAGASGKAQSVLSSLINLGLSQQTAFTAYEIGKNSVLQSDTEGGIINTENAEAENESGEGVHLRGSVQRSDGKNTEGQVSRVESDSGEAEGRRNRSRGPADGEAARLVNEGREVSVADLGIPGGVKDQKVYRLEDVEETASMKKARKAAEKRGLVVRFFAGDNLMLESKDGRIENVRGYIQGKYVYIRADHPYYTADQIMRHELGHDMVAKGEVAVNKVIERLKKLVGKKNVEAVAEFYAKAYASTGLSVDEVWEEVICDSIGDMNVFSGDEAISKFIEPMLKEIKKATYDAKSKANQTRGSPEEKASIKMGTFKNAPHYSRETFDKQVDDVLSGVDTTHTHLKIMNTPTLLQDAGLPNLPILMTAKHLKTITRAKGKDRANYHGLDVEIVKNLPKYINDPVIIADSLTRDDSVVIITEALDNQGNPVIAAILLNGTGMLDGEYIDANIMTSAYGKDNFQTFINRIADQDAIIYWNKNKSQDLSVNLGLRLPNIITRLASNTIIRKAKAFVNINSKNNSKGKASRELDSLGNELSPAVQKRFEKSTVVDYNGRLKVVYHGTTSGEFYTFDKAKGSVEGDFGSGFYFTDNLDDVSNNYEGGGPDFENKVWRRAEQIFDEDPDIQMDEAKDKARAELYKGSNKFEVYLNVENPAIVGETILFDPESYAENYYEEDYDNYDDYIGDVEQLLADDIDSIIWDIENSIDLYGSTDGIRNVLIEAYYEGGIDIEKLKSKINELYLESTDGEIVGNEVTRQIIESLGYDGIVDSTVSSKFKNMGMEADTTHYIVFNPNQIKAVTNQNPTDNPDIRYSRELDTEYLSAVNRGDMEAAQRMVDEAAKKAGYIVKAYHGTSRGDRVGNVFLPERATSGPMAFFTDNRVIAEGYSKGKQDTSMAYDPDFDRYETQFRIKTKYNDMPLYRAWGYLPFDARNRITKKAGQLRENWDGDGELILDPTTNEAGGGFQWQLKESRGNAIQALTEQWLNSGNLFNEEARFLDVLEMAGVTEEFKKIGMDSLYFKDPHARHEKVYDTFLKINNPLDTSLVDEKFVTELEAWYEEQDQSKYERESVSADLWDKNSIDAYDFAERVREDIERGTFHAWTSIPDSVTDYLKHMGYDGIKDVGGKNGGEGHTVWIPFSSEQVKSAEPVVYDESKNVIPLSKRFNPENKDIRYSRELDLIDYINENGDGEITANNKPLTNREILANALESAAKSEIEREKLKQYRDRINMLNRESLKLSEINKEIKELTFGKVEKNPARLKELKDEAIKTTNRINMHDKKLLSLEAAKPIKDVLQREKQKAYKKAAEKGREALHKNVEGRHETAERNALKALKEKFVKMMDHPTERQYIPANLISAMVDVCQMIDTDTELYKEDGSINKAQQKRNEQMQRLLKLRDEYAALGKNPDPMYSGEFDQDILDYLDELRQDYAGKSIKDMTLVELKEFRHILRAIDETLRDARKLIGWGEADLVYDAGDAIIAEQAAITKKRKGKGEATAVSAVIDNSLSPLRNVKRMADYNSNSPLVKAFRGIEVGARNKNKFAMDAHKSFEPLTTGKNEKTYEDAIYKPFGKEYVDKEGRKFHVSKMQMMQAIMSYNRELANDKLKHVSEGGFTFADIKKLNEGKLKDAIDPRYAHSVTFGAVMAEQFKAELANDSWAQEYMKTAEEFFDGKAKDAINKANMILKHRIVATGSKYIPYEVNKDFVVHEITSENDIQQTINSYGMMKDLKQNATQPLIITGLNNILERHIDQVSNIHGLAVPIRNFNKIWNVKASDGSTTVQEAIGRNFGNRGKQVMTQAVKDVQGSRISRTSDLYKKLRSGAISATFTGNLSVVTKQVGSLFTATAKMKWRDPASMIGNLFYTMANYKKIAAEVDTYTASAWMRRQGMSDAELHTLTTQAKKKGLVRLMSKLPSALNPTKWIAGMDSMVALSLWKYAKEDVAKHTGLEGEALLKATAEYYDDIIENTQSMGDALHRPEIQKSEGLIAETFGTFKTDLYQGAGLLADAVGEYKANPTKENANALARAITSNVMSAVWGSVMTSVFALLRYKVNRYRDDEDDELDAESWLKVQGSDLASNLVGYVIPLFGGELYDIISAVINGEQVDSFDSLVLDSLNELVKAITGISNATKDGEMPSVAAYTKLINSIGSVFGIPATNITRIIEAIKLHAQDIANGEFLSFEAGLTSPNKTRLYNAYLEGDADKIEKASRLYEDKEIVDPENRQQDKEKAIASALKSAMRENDPRVKEAALARLDGDEDKYWDIMLDVIEEAKFDMPLIKEAFEAEYNYHKGKKKDAEERGKTYP